jgi:phosphoribosylaminoimidazolecarboxamide formyltransferase/IMP cyclohydrolase
LATKKNLRVLITGQILDITQKRPLIKPVSGGFLVQDSDNGILTPDMMRVVTNHAPAPALLQDLQFAFTVCKMVKSNAIVFAKHTATLGIGAGQMSRIDSTQIATAKANMIEHGILKGAVMASDAFFPFPDNVEAAAKSGIAAIIQPGGSIKDKDVIQAANDLGIAMIFTGMRHFRH